MILNIEVIEKYRLSNIRIITAPTSLNTLYSAQSAVYQNEVVLKFYKNVEECLAEAKFLKFYHNEFFVELFDSMPEQALNVVEKIEPGDSYAQDFPKNEDSAVEDICNIVDYMRNLHINPTGDFVNVSSYFTSLDENYETVYKLPIQKCKMIFDALISKSDAKNQYLLHGDLHHENILKSYSHKAGFAVIDPKGVIGECGFELACFILNPILFLAFDPNAKHIIANRIKKILKRIELDSERLLQWCFVKAVLGSCFAIEDNLIATRDQFIALSLVCESLLRKIRICE